jgi:hypothetical protein
VSSSLSAGSSIVIVSFAARAHLVALLMG